MLQEYFDKVDNAATIKIFKKSPIRHITYAYFFLDFLNMTRGQ